MLGLVIFFLAAIILIPIAVIKEKIYVRKHRDQIDMKKRAIVLWSLRSIVLIIVVALGLFIYKTGYEKTELGSYEKGDHKLTIWHIGVPDFPFGASYCRLELDKDGRKVEERDFTLWNDGKWPDSENFTVSWQDDRVMITAHGEEQDDRTYALFLSEHALHELSEPIRLHANLIEWNDDSFRVQVCDEMANDVFPNGGLLTVEFVEGTYFIDLDGSRTDYVTQRKLFEPTVARKLKWVEGMVLDIEITAYQDFVDDNDFYNRAKAGRIENIDVIAIDVSEGE
ncbi:MAG: hypothetical protein K6A14_00555 [Erysipelotrichaceae bacterium]|nr:hypothetical protein [Erysipelotrichaceae bacterium]